MSYVEVHTTACHSGMDGDCSWSECPQEANNRANYQSYCPLARQPVEPWVRSDERAGLTNIEGSHDGVR